MAAALGRDAEVRGRYMTAVVARVCGLDWSVAAQLAQDPAGFPQPVLVAQGFAREAVSDRDAGARWCAAAMLQALPDRKVAHVVVIEVRNAELMETVTNEAKPLDITNGAIVSLIGAVDSFTISTMPQHDATKDIITDYSLPAEMTGSGAIINGTVHIHAGMAIEGDQAVAGHLHRAEIGTFFGRAYIISS